MRRHLTCFTRKHRTEAQYVYRACETCAQQRQMSDVPDRAAHDAQRRRKHDECRVGPPGSAAVSEHPAKAKGERQSTPNPKQLLEGRGNWPDIGDIEGPSECAKGNPAPKLKHPEERCLRKGPPGSQTDTVVGVDIRPIRGRAAGAKIHDLAENGV